MHVVRICCVASDDASETGGLNEMTSMKHFLAECLFSEALLNILINFFYLQCSPVVPPPSLSLSLSLSLSYTCKHTHISFMTRKLYALASNKLFLFAV